MPDFLFELGVEEVPVLEIKNVVEQLKDKLEARFKEHQVQYNSIETAATNKRFMVYVSKIDEKTENKEEEILGPAKKIAIDENGQPTLALQKFMEAHQVELGDTLEIETPKGTYIGIHKFIPGKKTGDMLEKTIPQILGEIQFSKTMVWNASRVSFVRPVKNILALFDNRLIKFEFAGIPTSNKISGHSLLSEHEIEINSFKDYVEKLHKNFVIVREEERKEKILSEIKDIEEEMEAHVPLKEEMLHYYIYNNEYPVVFNGEFDAKYLELPHEIIAAFMIKEKKLIPVYKQDQQMLNMFVGVSNIPDENKFVSTGNERVIRATFDDAKFFWDNDRKDDFKALRDGLKKVTFQKELGTFYDKTERLALLAEALVRETGNVELSESLKKAGLLCKNDLITRMVREFPSLQGVMGGLYLREMGIDLLIWQSVYGHYEPKGYTDDKLEHLGAGLLSVADKMDNIAALLSKGVKISSSKDPYGIRRDSNAIIKIIVDFQLDFDLSELIRAAAEPFADTPEKRKPLVRQITELFFYRIENLLKDVVGIRYDIVNSVLNSDKMLVYQIYLRARDVQKMEDTEPIQHLIIIHKRLKNLIKDCPPYSLSRDLLVEKEETLLYEIFKESRGKIEDLIARQSYVQACSEIVEMKPLIDGFFDNVLVMDKDEKIKQNRIALLQKFDELLAKIADFSVIFE